VRILPDETDGEAMIYTGLLALALAGNLTVGDTHMAKIWSVAPTHIFVVGNGRGGDEWKEIFHVTTDGRIILGPGASLDEASLAFWQALEQALPGICQQRAEEGRP